MSEKYGRKAFKEKLMPTPVQERALEHVLHHCRILYNAALEQRIYVYKQRGIAVLGYDQGRELKLIRSDLAEYAIISAHVLYDVIVRLERTYQAFFKRIARGEKPGFPRFKGAGRYNSFTYKEYGNSVRLKNGRLVLYKIGNIAVRWSRPVEGVIKTVTISKEPDGWYVCFSCVDAPSKPLPLTGKATGIDLGVKVFLVTADGLVIGNPRHEDRMNREVTKARRRVSRRKKGSHRCKKAGQLLARKLQRLRRQRKDFHYKTALTLVREYDVIYHEAIQPANLTHRPAPIPDNHGGYLRNGAAYKATLNRLILDAAWSQFLTILAFKAAWAGKRVEAVPPAYTSQDCSGCGKRVPKTLRDRTHSCPECGLVLDRDENAARNIQRAGQALRGVVA